MDTHPVGGGWGGTGVGVGSEVTVKQEVFLNMLNLKCLLVIHVGRLRGELDMSVGPGKGIRAGELLLGVLNTQ